MTTPPPASNAADTLPLSAPQAIRQRRATRRFDPSRPISPALLAQVLDLARQAPSAYNLQPWRFIVVRDSRHRQRLQKCAYGQAKIAEAPVVLIVLGYHTPERSHLDPIVSDQEARGLLTPAQASALRGTIQSGMRKITDRSAWALRSTMLAAATLLIAAESLGLASAPMEGFDPDRVREAFGIPDDHTLCCLIALGYPRETKPNPGRLPLEALCYDEHFGQPTTLPSPPSTCVTTDGGPR